MTAFQEAVLRVVRIVPQGHVMSYGQVAAFIGTPRAARQVGWAMHSMEGVPDFPWWRIVNNAGIITIKGSYVSTAQLQKELLEHEGVLINEAFELDIKAYRYRPDEAILLGLNLEPDYVKDILSKFDIV